MSNKTFTVAGITAGNGISKVRFTNDMSRRVKVFAKGDANRVDLVELPNAMTKIEALKYLLTVPNFANAEDQATITETLSDRERESRRGEVRVKAKSTVKNVNSLNTETVE